MVEFVEGEPNHFILVTGDHRLHFKAAVLEEKQQWVKYLRSSILSMSSQTAPVKMDRNANASKALLEPEALVSTDLQPSPTASPFHHKRKEFVPNGNVSTAPRSTSPQSPKEGGGIEGFDRVSVSYPPTQPLLTIDL